MIFVIYLIFFILGLVIGSFLNCLIYRLEKEESIKGRSYCPHCRHTLFWRDLIPLASFFYLKGKCRYCHKKISAQYPIVELVTGILFLLVFSYQAPSLNHISLYQILNLLFTFYITSSLLVIFIYDVKHFLIPDNVLFPAIFIAFLYQLIFQVDRFFLDTLWASLAAFLFFWLIFFLSKETWMGFGDCKLVILLGLLLGYKHGLLALFLSFFFGAIIGLGFMMLSKKGLKSQMPFAPFLITGTFIALVFGNQIISAYLHFVLSSL